MDLPPGLTPADMGLMDEMDIESPLSQSTTVAMPTTQTGLTSSPATQSVTNTTMSDGAALGLGRPITSVPDPGILLQPGPGLPLDNGGQPGHGIAAPPSLASKVGFFSFLVSFKPCLGAGF